MRNQAANRLDPDESITRPGETFSRSLQRPGQQFEGFSFDLCPHQSQYGSNFLDIFPRAMNLLSISAIFQTFGCVLDPLSY
jgi:hypothetical protein